MRRTAFDRFWPKVDKRGPDECWPWVAAKNFGGYGVFRLDGRQINAHRASYIMHVGPIDDGLVVDHLCNNPPCVNPAHLQAVTQSENVRRSSGPAGRHRNTHCSKGHAYTPDNTHMEETRGGRYVGRRCRKCHADRERQRRARVKASLGHGAAVSRMEERHA